MPRLASPLTSRAPYACRSRLKALFGVTHQIPAGVLRFVEGDVGPGKDLVQREGALSARRESCTDTHAQVPSLELYLRNLPAYEVEHLHGRVERRVGQHEQEFLATPTPQSIRGAYGSRGKR